MSNTYSNFNKFKATKIYGNFEVKDYIDSTGTTQDIGTMAVQNDIVSGTVGSNICSCGSLDVLGTINCDTVLVNSSCQYNFKTVGYITSFSLANFNSGQFPLPFIPLCKSILDPTLYCSRNINLFDIFNQLVPNVYIYLYPSYKLDIYINQTIIYTLDNTNGTDITLGFIQNQLLNITSIMIYCNNIPIL